VGVGLQLATLEWVQPAADRDRACWVLRILWDLEMVKVDLHWQQPTANSQQPEANSRKPQPESNLPTEGKSRPVDAVIGF